MTTPKLRFKEFDGDWSTNKIEEISIVTSGGTPSRNVSDYWNGDIPWVTTSLVDFNVINEAEEFITQVGLDNSSAKLFPKDTILMAMYGQGITRGKVAILGIDATTNQACAAIKLKNGFETKFIFQNLMNRYEEIRDLSNEGGQKNLSAGIIKEILISFPEKEEQTKIASFLSAVDEKISQLTQKHALLSQYKQGMMQKLFSQQIRFKADDGSEFGEWEEKTLGSLGVFKSGQGFPEKYQGGKTGVPFFKVSDMNTYGNEKRMVVANNYVDADSILEMKVKVILDESIIFAKVGAAVFLERKRLATNFLIDNNMMAFTPDPKLNINFIKQFLDTIKFSNFVQVGALPSYNAGDLAIIPIHIPCVVEQTKIANFLSAIDQKIDVVAQQIEQTKQWKKGLLQQMFV